MELKKTILIIEDDLDQQRLYKIILEKKGYSAIGRANALAGLRWLEQVLPDLILLDIMLPEMSGIDMLKLIRLSPNGQKVPVIIASASRFEEKDFLPHQVNAVLQKPILPDKLV